MLGNMTEELSRKTLKNYVKLGDRLGHWSSLDQVTLNTEGVTTRRLYAEWTISKEEYEKK